MSRTCVLQEKIIAAYKLFGHKVVYKSEITHAPLTTYGIGSVRHYSLGLFANGNQYTAVGEVGPSV